MKVNFNVTGPARKELAQRIGEKVGMKPVYKGMPSAAYAINNYTLNKDGSLEWDERTAASDAELLIEKLVEEGYEVEVLKPQEAAQAAEMEASEATGLTVSIPLENVALGNLINLLESKGELIKKALGIKNTFITEEDEKVSFAWFDEVTPEEVTTYTKFIAALCKMSMEQKRISSKAKDYENEKYAFRCFLLRLGFIGDEYKADRKLLLRNLSGSSAFKSGAKKGGEE